MVVFDDSLNVWYWFEPVIGTIQPTTGIESSPGPTPSIIVLGGGAGGGGAGAATTGGGGSSSTSSSSGGLRMRMKATAPMAPAATRPSSTQSQVSEVSLGGGGTYGLMNMNLTGRGSVSSFFATMLTSCSCPSNGMTVP